MNSFVKELPVKTEIESWKDFADSLHSQGDKEHFREMLKEYHKYFTAISAEPESFPSKQLVVALLSSQYKRIIHWLMEKGFQTMRMKSDDHPCNNIF